MKFRQLKKGFKNENYVQVGDCDDLVLLIVDDWNFANRKYDIDRDFDTVLKIIVYFKLLKESK